MSVICLGNIGCDSFGFETDDKESLLGTNEGLR